MGTIRDHRDLDLYKMALEAATTVLALNRAVLPEERCSSNRSDAPFFLCSMKLPGSPAPLYPPA